MSAMFGPALRMLVSLAIVLALMYVAARLLARSKGIPTGGPRATKRVRRSLLAAVTGAAQTSKRGRRPARTASPLEVLARQPLGKSASVSLVRVADKVLLVGVTDSTVQLLSELDAAQLEDEEPTADLLSLAPSGLSRTEHASSRTAVSVLDQLRERTVRRA